MYDHTILDETLSFYLFMDVTSNLSHILFILFGSEPHYQQSIPLSIIVLLCSFLGMLFLRYPILKLVKHDRFYSRPRAFRHFHIIYILCLPLVFHYCLLFDSR